MRVLIATCTALFVLRLVDLAYFGGTYTDTAETVIRNVVFAIARAI